MDYWQSLILGIVQGFTEFLPVSSSGHLVVFQKLLGVIEHDLIFDISVHIGTLLSILVVYRHLIKKIIVGCLNALKAKHLNKESNLFLAVVVGSIPTAAIGFTFKDYFESAFSNPQLVAGCFVITGIMLFFTKSKGGDLGTGDFASGQIDEVPNWKQALLIGTFQGMAIAPGISRSGTTIAFGLFSGLSRKTSALFSFLLAIPAIFGAGLLQIKDIAQMPEDGLYILGFGLLVSFVAGLIGLSSVLYFVRKGQLQYFSYYLWALALGLFLF